jgi:hypothetical protein
MADQITDPMDPCIDKQGCTFAVKDRKIPCAPNGNECQPAVMAEAKTSAFHDQTLADATQKIKQVLASIPPDTQGRKLSFLRTPRGTLLAWVHHGAKIPPGAVPATADEKTLSKALGLKPRPRARQRIAPLKGAQTQTRGRR